MQCIHYIYQFPIWYICIYIYQFPIWYHIYLYIYTYYIREGQQRGNIDLRIYSKIIKPTQRSDSLYLGVRDPRVPSFTEKHEVTWMVAQRQFRTSVSSKQHSPPGERVGGWGSWASSVRGRSDQSREWRLRGRQK